jgi:hypothetical protein
MFPTVKDNPMRRLLARSHETYLVPKSRLNVKPITLRLSVALLDELSALKERAEKAGFVLDVQAAVTEALERTAAQVAASLDDMENGTTLPGKPVVEGKGAPRAGCKPGLVEGQSVIS